MREVTNEGLELRATPAKTYAQIFNPFRQLFWHLLEDSKN